MDIPIKSLKVSLIFSAEIWVLAGAAWVMVDEECTVR